MEAVQKFPYALKVPQEAFFNYSANGNQTELHVCKFKFVMMNQQLN